MKLTRCAASHTHTCTCALAITHICRHLNNEKEGGRKPACVTHTHTHTHTHARTHARIHTHTPLPPSEPSTAHLPSQSAGTCEPMVKEATVLTMPLKLVSAQLRLEGDRATDMGLPAAAGTPARAHTHSMGQRRQKRQCMCQAICDWQRPPSPGARLLGNLQTPCRPVTAQPHLRHRHHNTSRPGPSSPSANAIHPCLAIRKGAAPQLLRL
jgi:hypothetical protein